MVKFSVVTAENRKKVSKVKKTRNRTTGISFSNIKKTSEKSEFKAEIVKEKSYFFQGRNDLKVGTCKIQ